MRVGSEGFENVTGRVGSGQEVFDMSPVESGRVNKSSVLAGRVGSGLDKRFSNLTGRVG